MKKHFLGAIVGNDKAKPFVIMPLADFAFHISSADLTIYIVAAKAHI
jgi:hypothetical protein